MTDKTAKFVELFGVPEVAVPCLKEFFSDEEIEVVVAFDGQELTPEEGVARLGLPSEEALKVLEDAYLKHVLDKKEEDGTTYYTMGTFYEKLDYQCKFDEGFLDLPKDVRDGLDQYCYDVYKEKMIRFFDKIKQGEPVDKEKETFLLLEDLDAFLGDSKEYRVVPCNCRILKQGCSKPIDVCMRFDRSIDDRTFGKIISREDARSIVEDAHKKGLMHTVNRDWKEKGPKYMCNCCTTCCYPFRLVEDLGIKGLWPKILYVARYDRETCNFCGKCTQRCMFEAFSHTGEEVEYKGKTRKDVAYDESKCFGCGLCATTCPTGSITMHKVD